jgi:hypothetical protein
MKTLLALFIMLMACSMGLIVVATAPSQGRGTGTGGGGGRFRNSAAAWPRRARALPRALHPPLGIRNPPSRLRRYGGQVPKRQARLNNLEL